MRFVKALSMMPDQQILIGSELKNRIKTIKVNRITDRYSSRKGITSGFNKK
jgi:hypothetical protein